MCKKLKKLIAVSIATLSILGCSLTASAKFAGNSTFTFVDGTKIGYSISEKSPHKINMSDLTIEYDKNGNGLYTHVYAITNTFKNQRTVGNKILYINNDEKNCNFDKKLQTLRINGYLDTFDYPMYAQMINKEGDIVVSFGDKSMMYYNASLEDYSINKIQSTANDDCYEVIVSVKVDEFHIIIDGSSMKLGEMSYGNVTDISYIGASSVYDDDSTYAKVSFNVDADELKKGLKLTWYGYSLGTIKTK